MLRQRHMQWLWLLSLAYHIRTTTPHEKCSNILAPNFGTCTTQMEPPPHAHAADFCSPALVCQKQIKFTRIQVIFWIFRCGFLKDQKVFNLFDLMLNSYLWARIGTTSSRQFSIKTCKCHHPRKLWFTKITRVWAIFSALHRNCRCAAWRQSRLLSVVVVVISLF